jgi:phosphoglycerate dehydrogenase-like enzyme
MPFEVEITRLAFPIRTDDLGEVAAMSELTSILRVADVVVLALPLPQAACGMVDARFLFLVKADALLVNVSRGPVVNTNNLVAELSSRRSMAALDIVVHEPLPADHPIWASPRTLITPDLRGDTAAFQPRIQRLLRQQIERAMRGESLSNVIC